MIFHWSLSDTKSPHVSRNLHSIQYCSMNCLYSSSYSQILQSLYQSFSDCSESTSYNWYFQSLSCSRVFPFPWQNLGIYRSSRFFRFYCAASQYSRVHNSASCLFLLIIIKLSRLAEIKRSVCILKSQCSLCISFSRTDSWLCIWTNLNFLHNSPLITLPTQSCVVL